MEKYWKEITAVILLLGGCYYIFNAKSSSNSGSGAVLNNINPTSQATIDNSEGSGAGSTVSVMQNLVNLGSANDIPFTNTQS